MPPLVPLEDWLDAIYCSANEYNSEEFISTNSTDSEYDTIKYPILFSQKHLNDLLRNLRLFKEKIELLAWKLKERNRLKKMSK